MNRLTRKQADALARLTSLIDQGAEYPSAEEFVTRECHLSERDTAAVRAAYDAGATS